MQLFDTLKAKIYTLNKHAWEGRADWPVVELWLDNFTGICGDHLREQLHALYLLSQFMYFGSAQVRELLRAMFRDLVRYPIVAEIRRRNGNTKDGEFLEKEFKKELGQTRFIGMGNPSESGVHLLYYFRQENRLPKQLFVDGSRIISRQRRDGKSAPVLREPDVRRYVFIDDICASGQQAKGYSEDLLQEILALDSKVTLHYLSLIATTSGMDSVRKETLFGERAQCVFELDDSYRCFSASARYFAGAPVEIDRAFAQTIARTYGSRLMPTQPLGYKDGQLLLGFHHNTPDNTLPIIWYEDSEGAPWSAMFRRYPKEVEL